MVKIFLCTMRPPRRYGVNKSLSCVELVEGKFFNESPSIKMIFRSFLPNKLQKHQKCCTLENPMKNLNRVKGMASRLEAMMKKQERNKLTGKKRSIEQATDVNTTDSANPDTESGDSEDLGDCGDDNHIEDCICEQNIEEVPTLDDINKIITESQILENTEQSRQLFLLIKLFIQVRVKIDEVGEETRLPPV